MKTKNIGFFFLLPGLLGFALFYLYPFLLSVGYSFMNNPIKQSFVGLSNYVQILKNPAFLLGLSGTAKFIALSVPINMVLSFLVAYWINKKSSNDKFTILFLIPLVIPSGSMVFFWKSIWDKHGVLNSLLANLNISGIDWLNSEFAMVVMVIIFIWKNFGFNTVLYLTALRNIDKEYYEAAKIDGAGAFQTFRNVTLPLIRSTNIVVLTMSIVNSFKVFKEIYLITGMHPHNSIYTLQHFLNNMFANLNYPQLTTATTVLVIIISIITQLLLKWERKLDVN